MNYFTTVIRSLVSTCHGRRGLTKTLPPTLSLTDRATASFMEWSRVLSTSTLEVGQYCVVVAFTQGNRTVRRTDRIVITPHAGVGTDIWTARNEARQYAESPGLAPACGALAT